MNDEQHVDPFQEARRLAMKELGLPKKVMNDRREKVADLLYSRLGEPLLPTADAILALFADELRDAERWREVCYDWGYGVLWGFLQFEDFVSSRMTDAEQKAAIDEAKGA